MLSLRVRAALLSLRALRHYLLYLPHSCSLSLHSLAGMSGQGTDLQAAQGEAAAGASPPCISDALGFTASWTLCCRAPHHTHPVPLDMNPGVAHKHLTSCFPAALSDELSHREVGAALRKLSFSLLASLDGGKAGVCRKCRNLLVGGEAGIVKHLQG